MSAPDPRFLVDQIIPERALAVLIGAPGAGKTFLALDIGLCICTNQTWLDHETLTGGVIYITSEGLSGLKLRLQAWEMVHGAIAENFGYITQAPQFLDASEISALIINIKSSKISNPALIVIDTLARHMVGGEENSAQSMGEFVANVDRLRAEFGCAVLIVHHTGKHRRSTSVERGSSALRGAADTMILLEKSAGAITISCEKQKDGEPFEGIQIVLQQVDLPEGGNSCVITRDVISLAGNGKLDEPKEKILAALLQADPTGLRTKEIRLLTRIPESSYHRHREHLVTNGYIESGPDQQYILTPKGKEYALTLKPLSEDSHRGALSPPITPTTL